ncbi:MAG: DsrE family protein [Solirubrobacteraceae bacterium]
MADTERLFLMVTHGPEDPELAILPFALAGAAVASDVEVVMGFQSEGCELMKKGVAETVSAPEFAPLGELVPMIQEMGGKFLVCAPCVNSRGLTEDDLIDGVEVVAAARFVAEIMPSDHALVY